MFFLVNGLKLIFINFDRQPGQRVRVTTITISHPRTSENRNHDSEVVNTG